MTFIYTSYLVEAAIAEQVGSHWVCAHGQLCIPIAHAKLLAECGYPGQTGSCKSAPTCDALPVICSRDSGTHYPGSIIHLQGGGLSFKDVVPLHHSKPYAFLFISCVHRERRDGLSRVSIQPYFMILSSKWK